MTEERDAISKQEEMYTRSESATKKSGNWASIAVYPETPWPEQEEQIRYRGHLVWVIPSEDNKFPMVAIECGSEKITKDEAFKLLRRFLSSLVWSLRRRIRIEGNSGGTFATRWEMPKGAFIIKSTSPVHFDYLPEPENAEARLSLALYREAFELTNPAYQVLGFFKIFNVRFAGGEKQIAWINSTLSKFSEHKDLKNHTRLIDLRKEHQDVGRYLYASGRCAVAHASSDPVADPDEPADYGRLSKDVGLIRLLSEIFIEQELGVKSGQTIWEEHLYELAGFKEILGEEFLRILAQDTISEAEIDAPEFPRISIRLRDNDQFSALENMEVIPIAVNEHRVMQLKCEQGGGLVQVLLYLDFKNERLIIDTENGFGVFDDGSYQIARHAVDVMTFVAKYFLNGELLVVISETGKILGRCDPFIPTNIMPYETYKYYMAHAEKFSAAAEERKERVKDEPMPERES